MARIELSPDDYAEALDIARRNAAPILGARAQAELDDVANEAIARLLAQDPAPRNWGAWLNRVARNVAHDHVDRVGRIDPHHAPDEDQAELLRQFVARETATSEAAMLDAGIAFLTESLSARDRDLLLASVDGVRNAELAERFNLASAAVVAQTLSRIRGRLRARLAEVGYERHHPRPY